MLTQPSILAATADNLWPNTAACCRAVRPTDTQLLLVLCATRLLVVVGDGLMMNQFFIFASTAECRAEYRSPPRHRIRLRAAAQAAGLSWTVHRRAAACSVHCWFAFCS